jgi:3-deoxy-D-manno-octulosonic-acid transferase
LCEGRGLRVQSRSAGISPGYDTPIFLIDGIGELRKFYGTADIAFIGGSLVPHGGQNPLEAALAGIPVLFGPHMFNFAEITRNLLSAGAGFQIQDSGTMALKVSELFQEPNLRQTMGSKGEVFVKSNRGALDKVMSIIDSLNHKP